MLWLIKWLRRRRLHKLRGPPIAEIADQQIVRVTGRVKARDGVLRADLSGRGCVYQKIERIAKVEGASWAVASEKARDFLLVDDTAIAVVWMEHRHSWADGAHVAYNVECAADYQHSERSRETVIVEGDRLAIRGRCVILEELSPYRKTDKPPRLRLEAPGAPLQIEVLEHGAERLGWKKQLKARIIASVRSDVEKAVQQGELPSGLRLSYSFPFTLYLRVTIEEIGSDVTVGTRRSRSRELNSVINRLEEMIRAHNKPPWRPGGGDVQIAAAVFHPPE